ncbi:tetratricopeptide repeat protein [Comamonas sp. 4034]|uniref:tetratricopeptide repeat protein n=1 Tax=Comamonas sp. 4034 TaxID=3156455 RepID=UPI00320BC923
MKHHLIASLAVLSVVSCTNIPHFNRPPPDTGIRYDSKASITGIPTMSAAELTRQKGLANNGDGRAAFNVYTYYRSTANDQPKAMEWLLMSGELGYPSSQYILAQIYRHENNYERAIYWARKARDSGYPNAQSTLESLESEQP